LPSPAESRGSPRRTAKLLAGGTSVAGHLTDADAHHARAPARLHDPDSRGGARPLHRRGGSEPPFPGGGYPGPAPLMEVAGRFATAAPGTPDWIDDEDARPREPGDGDEDDY